MKKEEVVWEKKEDGTFVAMSGDNKLEVYPEPDPCGKRWLGCINDCVILNKKPLDILTSGDPEHMKRVVEYCIRHNTNEASVTDKFDVKEWLKSLLCEDEALAVFTVDGYYSQGYCIIPNDADPERVDIASLLELTLHRLLDAEAESDGSDPVFCSYSIDEVIDHVLLATQDTENEYADKEEEITEIDLGYIIPGLLTSFKRVPLTAVGFEKKLYERYKLLWMLDQGITLQDAFSEWRDYCDPENGFDRGTSNEDAFDSWESDCGFSGSLYPCFGEFVDVEYQQGDERLMPWASERHIWKLDQPE